MLWAQDDAKTHCGELWLVGLSVGFVGLVLSVGFVGWFLSVGFVGWFCRLVLSVGLVGCVCVGCVCVGCVCWVCVCVLVV